MKLAISALNAKYVHTSLAARCLFGAVKNICDSGILEFSINDNIDSIISAIHAFRADAVSFSCYIWNVTKVLDICETLKLINPNLTIILGGYEVEFEAEKILNQYPFVDVVCKGEGEITYKDLIFALQNGEDLSMVDGICYRSQNGIVTTKKQTRLADLNELEFVYDDTIDLIKDRIIYYESSRGCPYGCTYCISGETPKVRFLDTERVKKELKFFIEHGVKLVKFVDRTFNANPKRAKEIFNFIAENASDTCFHMELAGDLIDNETVEILKSVKEGTIQFEIGVQTTNTKTMQEINRKISFEKLSANVKKLINLGTIHIHLDLIAGLPYEDINSFRKSLGDVLELKPHVLQLGFLKLLKGSVIRKNSDKHGYVFRSFAPYEVLANSYISYGELLELKGVECALDRYYNSGSFKKSLEFLFNKYNDKYDLFLDISKYFKSAYPENVAFSKQMLFDALYVCFLNYGEEFAECLRFDYLQSFKVAKRPLWFGEYDKTLLQKAYEIFKDEAIKQKEFPWYYDIPAKEIMKHLHIEKFSFGTMVFDYKYNKVYDVTKLIK